MHRHEKRTGPQPPAHRPPQWLSLAAACLFAGMFPLSAAAQGADDLWEVTTKMEMAGMPMAMPAQTSRVCSPKNRKEEDYVPRREGCKMMDSSRVGGKLSYKMACDAMTAVGEISYSPEKYEGKTHMTGAMDGRQVDMTQTFSGKRVGNCTAPAK